MKDKSLLRKRLKRAALLVLLLYAAGRGESLAQNQVAILQHGEETTAFYGADAFKQAHTAAVDGDIITLSGLSFNVPSEVTKAITLRGAGVAADTVVGTQATVLSGVTFNVPYDWDTGLTLSVEGIRFDGNTIIRHLKNPVFTKCNFTSVSYYSSTSYPGRMYDAQFVDCKIATISFYKFENTSLLNSVVSHFSNISADYNVVATNSILRYESTGSYSSFFDGLSAYNSIIIREITGGPYPMPSSTCVFVNCIGINQPFGSGYTSNCLEYDEEYEYGFLDYEYVFETYDGVNFWFDSFTLTEEAASFETTDGTQVGIYGGYAPYTDKPSYVVRTQVTVPNRSNNEGKLNVEIEIIDEDE